MRALILVAGAALSLSACASLNGAPTASLQRGVYNAESDFAAALPVAVAYEALPTCSATQPFPCSDPKAVAKITAAARAARASLATAEAAVRSNSNGAALSNAALQAQADVATFVALVGAFAK